MCSRQYPKGGGRACAFRRGGQKAFVGIAD
jgi:FrmR/RcnR family transcriptional regulator, repressor of frmRAB operon